MDKLLKDDQELTQKLANHLLKHQEWTCLSQINLKDILRQNVDFAKRLLQVYLDQDNNTGVMMIVEVLEKPLEAKQLDKFSFFKRREFITVIQKVIKQGDLHHYRDGGKCVNNYWKAQLQSIDVSNDLSEITKCIEQANKLDYIEEIYQGVAGTLKTIPVHIGARDNKIDHVFFLCRKKSDKDNEYTICWLNGSNEFRYITFNEDGKVVS